MKYIEFKKFLKEKGIKLKDLASELGISYTALNYKFSGKQQFTIKQIVKLSIKFDFTVEESKRLFFIE